MVVMTAIVVTVVAWRLLTAESAYKKIRFPVSMFSGHTFEAPTDIRTVEVVITSQGALGWGCVYVYNYAPETGYDEIYRGCPAAPGWRDVDIEWLDGGLIRFSYIDPDVGIHRVELYVGAEPE